VWSRMMLHMRDGPSIPALDANGATVDKQSQQFYVSLRHPWSRA
jgi:hypothetical protein